MIIIETCCEYTEKTLFVSSDQQKWINRIKKLAEKYPDDVTIRHRPEDNDGCICATLPAEWLRIAPPRASNLTDEQRRAAAERMKALARKQKEGRLPAAQDE